MTSLKPARFLISGLQRPASLRPGRRRHAALLPRVATRQKSGPYGYTQAKALVYSKHGEPEEVLDLHTHAISPSLPTSSVLLRALAAPINPADINTIQGTYGALPKMSSLLGTPAPAAIPGNEGCFEVLATGSGAASSFQKGDWVIPTTTADAFGGTWRTHAVVENPDKVLLKVSSKSEVETSSLTPTQVATVKINPCSAWHMLRGFVDLVALSVKQGSGAWFVQNGANSGVGRAALQLAKLWGLRSVNVVRERETPEETEALKKELQNLGGTIVATEAEFLDRSFRERFAAEVTQGGRENVLLGLNCVGGKSATAVARCLGEGGQLITYGAMGRQPVMLPAGMLIFKDVSFRGFWMSRYAKMYPEENRKTIEALIKLMREGTFDVGPVDEVKWDWDTKKDVLASAVQGTLKGFRKGKGVFVFGDT